jgi:Right handed beta helix region
LGPYKHKLIEKFARRDAVLPGVVLKLPLGVSAWGDQYELNTSTTLTKVREENIMRQNAKFFALFLLVAMGAASQYAQAANLSVNCDKHESISKVLRLLAKTNPVGPNMVTVSGGCNENLVIRSMDRLTLITKTGASLTDRSGGNSVVVDIEDSHSVTVQGFTINGGGGGVLCNTTSVCYLTGNTIQDSGGTGVGVFADSHAVLESNVIQNNGFRGATVNDRSRMASSNDVFQGNGAQGVAVISGAYFGASNSSFLNNVFGVEAFLNSTVRVNGGTISGSVCASPAPFCGDGVVLLGGAQASFSGMTITANGGSGIHLEDGSFAVFFGSTITGNLSGTDVECAPQFPITRFVETTGGITNCVEPASKSQLKDLK